MICENCEVNAAQYFIAHYDEDNNIVEEFNYCEPCKINFADSLDAESLEEYGLQNLWS
jgi:protein-arginine kinase activator protein McsA